ncbi:related to SAM-dependent methyltransferases [Cephalotrichum gorgonifer]|uniref:Related to SAM-dependent methyltransferases n=1 Tax=Cephalotrichum gorgonifer TaxID=2041049 RepID=A0AAE8N1G9_9PEZI|nr:related to SAM-dependent methyltransferases [Cephalotrichum gorgonifer]
MSEQAAGNIPLSQADEITVYSIRDPDHPEIEVSQAKHRIRLINSWGIQPGSRLLEIGCGQGTCTAVLAEAVGPSGHVDAVDPAPLDYGAPFTLGQAQEFLSSGPVGSRIWWHRAYPTEFLAGTEGTWDAAVLLHCIWYFKEPKVLEDMLNALKGRVKRVYVAEYALHATEKTAVPHVLAAITRAGLEAHVAESEQNIRSAPSPTAIKEIGAKVGWSLERENIIVPEEGLLDGSWETGGVAYPGFLNEIDEAIKDPRVALSLKSGRDAVIAAAEGVGGVKKVTTMDVWAGVLVAP